MKNHETILVLDFGGQYNQLIARRVRDLSVYCEVVHNDISISEIKEKNPVGIIFTGGPSVVYEEDAPKVDPAIFELGVPILGICYGAQLTAYTLGGKVEASLKREYGKYIVKKIDFKNKKKISFKDASLVGDEIVKLFKNNEFDKCIIFYNKFKNVMTQIPQSQQLIPAKKEEDIKTEQESSYDFEPEEDEILEDLLPKNISTQIYKGFLENSASEQGSRMTAMDNATRNAGDLVEKLTINYNRSRQAAITKELIEIISGAESL